MDRTTTSPGARTPARTPNYAAIVLFDLITWGSQPHDTSDSSQGSWWVSLLTFGKGFHNYHHTYPSDYRNGPRWYDFDPSKWLIVGPAQSGLATSLRTRPKAAV